MRQKFKPSERLGQFMHSRHRFGSLENMCRERAALARKEMEYWLAEAEEWRRLREAPDRFMEDLPIQLDWCPELNGY
jgi:hypothetical protein